MFILDNFFMLWYARITTCYNPFDCNRIYVLFEGRCFHFQTETGKLPVPPPAVKLSLSWHVMIVCKETTICNWWVHNLSDRI